MATDIRKDVSALLAPLIQRVSGGTTGGTQPRTPTFTQEDDDGFGPRPGGNDGGGTGGGGGGTGGGGTIQPPTFEESSGLKGSGAVPQGFFPIPGMDGYFLNPATLEVGRFTQKTQYGETSFGFDYLDDKEAERVLKLLGLWDKLGGDLGSSGDPYAGAKFAETVRQNRIGEAGMAIESLMNRAAATAEGQLASAPYIIPPGSGGYFPSLSPTSPAVRAGLIDPMQYAPTLFDPARIERLLGDQAALAAELARIRGVAGV